MSESISLLGPGLMGRPMARTLLRAGHQVRGWNRSPLAPELVAGTPLCASLAETAAASICILVLA
ncbi:MAG: NAD(P)-binding domain-containing protein, partial [Chloroflexaceae bacterium]